MNESETRITLGSLQHVQDHAVEMLDSAMPMILDAEAAAQIGRFREDHARSARELSQMLSAAGGMPTPAPRAFDELEREHDRLMHESGREDEAMEALLLMEETAAAQYGLAVELELPAEAMATLKRHLDDELQHVRELQQRVHTLPVEIAGGGVAMDHMFVDDKNPDDFDDTTGMS